MSAFGSLFFDQCVLRRSNWDASGTRVAFRLARRLGSAKRLPVGARRGSLASEPGAAERGCSSSPRPDRGIVNSPPATRGLRARRRPRRGAPAAHRPRCDPLSPVSGYSVTSGSAFVDTMSTRADATDSFRISFAPSGSRHPVGAPRPRRRAHRLPGGRDGWHRRSSVRNVVPDVRHQAAWIGESAAGSARSCAGGGAVVAA